eukprot:COSAG01_NODE_1297_length_10848_cov_60.004279_13_plen_74_part_00
MRGQRSRAKSPSQLLVAREHPGFVSPWSWYRNISRRQQLLTRISDLLLFKDHLYTRTGTLNYIPWLRGEIMSE